MDLESWTGLVAALAAAGGAIGLLAGLFGIGGGAISVPVFNEVFGMLGYPEAVRMPLAVGTSLAMIIPTALMSARGHFLRGAVDTALLRAWAAPVTFGVLLGAAIARVADPAVFKLVFVCVAAVISARLLTGGRNWRIRDTLPGRWGLAGYGAVTGVLSALMGVGGGAISTMVLTLHGVPILNAVSTSAGVGVLIAIPGTIGYMLAGWGKPGLPADSIGYVSLFALALTAPTALLTTRLGVRLAHALSRRKLELSFGVFLLVVCARFLLELLR